MRICFQLPVRVVIAPALGRGEVLGASLTHRWAAGWGGILAEAFGPRRLCKSLCRSPSRFRLLFNDMASEQTPFQTRFFLLAPVLWVFFPSNTTLELESFLLRFWMTLPVCYRWVQAGSHGWRAFSF